MTAWTQEEDKQLLRGLCTFQTNKETAFAINKAVYHGLPIKTRQQVNAHIHRRPQPLMQQCRKMFAAGKSTKTIAFEMGCYESEIYNLLAWSKGTMIL